MGTVRDGGGRRREGGKEKEVFTIVRKEWFWRLHFKGALTHQNNSEKNYRSTSGSQKAFSFAF